MNSRVVEVVGRRCVDRIQNRTQTEPRTPCTHAYCGSKWLVDDRGRLTRAKAGSTERFVLQARPFPDLEV